MRIITIYFSFFFLVFSHELDAQVIELPYKECKDLSMFIFLPSSKTPSEDYGIKMLVDRMNADPGILSLENIFNNAERKLLSLVKVSLPRFTIEMKMTIHDIIPMRGTPDPPGRLNNLSGFFNNNPIDLQFFNILHKSKYEFKEDKSVPTNTDFSSAADIFNANHPFVYMIYDKVFRCILYYGVYQSP